MEILHLNRGTAPQRLDALERLPDEGFVWLDFVRGVDCDWEAWPRRLLGVELDRRHVEDSRDAAHVSFFDVAPGYDLLVFEDAGHGDDPSVLETGNVSFFLFERLLVCVHAADCAAARSLKHGFERGTMRAPANVRVLTHMLLDVMGERFLAVSERFNQRMDDFQANLLDPKNPFKDWTRLLDGRRDVRRVEHLCEGQIKSLERWHRRSNFEWSNPEETRLHDVCEHITRVRHAAADLERHIEAAVQLYFASTSHRTNEIVRVLTVFSAIFLPLTFIAGIYGMNFRNMPELSFSFGYPALLLVMGIVAALLLRYFRRRGYF
jgi:magnesium transporter